MASYKPLTKLPQSLNKAQRQLTSSQVSWMRSSQQVATFPESEEKYYVMPEGDGDVATLTLRKNPEVDKFVFQFP